MKLKLKYYDDIKNKDWLDIVDDGEFAWAKLTANKLDIEPDRKDPRNIKNIRKYKKVKNKMQIFRVSSALLK